MSKELYALWHPTEGFNQASLGQSEYHAWVRFSIGDIECDFPTFKERAEKQGWRARKVKLALVDEHENLTVTT